MATYVVLVDFTEQGMRKIKDTTKRASDLPDMGRSLDINVKDVYWTSGIHDGVLIFDAPDEKAAASFLLAVGKQGYVHTHTLRAFSQSEIQSILEKMP